MATDLEARMRQLEARVTQLEDDKAIREVLARYGYNADGGRDQAYVDLYTDDGVVNIGTYVSFGSGYKDITQWKGKKEIMGFITDPKAHKAIEGRCMHVQGNNFMTVVNGDDAKCYSYSMVLLKPSPEYEGVAIRSAGYSEWTMKKVNGKWLIKERVRRAAAGQGAKELLAKLPK